MIVRNSEKAKEVKEALADGWEVYGYKDCTMGKRYTTIFVVEQPESFVKPEEWENWINKAVKTRLKNGGLFIKLY